MTPTGIVVQLGLPEVLSGLTLEHPAVRAAGAIAVLVLGYYVARLVGQVLGRPAAQRFKRPSVTRAVLRSARLAVGLIGPDGVVDPWPPPGRYRSLDHRVLGGSWDRARADHQEHRLGAGRARRPALRDRRPRRDPEHRTAELHRGHHPPLYEDVHPRQHLPTIPNSTIRKRDVTNFSAEDEWTRQSLSAMITYESDIDAARGVIEEAARETPRSSAAVRISASVPPGTRPLRPAISRSMPITAGC